MTFLIAIPVLLRIAASLVFVVAVIVAAAMNRSIMLVPLLAAAATLSHWLAARLAPNPLSNLGEMLAPGAARANPAGKLIRKFLFGVFGYGLVFALTVLISAVFQETELERIVTRFDLTLIAVAAGLAIVLSVINAHTAATQVTGMMGDLQQAFNQMQGGPAATPGGEEPFTFEGEIIHPDDDPGDPKP